MSEHLEDHELIQRILGKDYLHIRLSHLVLEEDFQHHRSRVKFQVSAHNGGEEQVVEAEGVGLVDALFHGLLGRFAKEYPSLNSIEFARFEIHARPDTKRESAGADAMGEVRLGVKNSEGKLFEFTDSSRSITQSAATAVVESVEYFVNSERAFVMLYKSLLDAKERNREDLVSRYTRELAQVVKSTSYTEVIDQIKKNLG